MSRRHLTRSIVLQALYQWDFYNRKADLLQIIDHDMEEFGVGLEDEHRQFFFKLVHGIVTHIDEIDETIKRVAPEWPLDRVAIVDRNVLRIGLYELLYADHEEVPPKVAINEAIEMAKSYGGPNAGRFVNGVLGTVYREIKAQKEKEREKEGGPDEKEKPKE